MHDERPFGENLLSLAVKKNYVGPIALGLKCCDPTLSGEDGRTVPDIAAENLKDFQNQTRWKPGRTVDHMMAWVDRVGEGIVSDTHLPMASLDRARRILDTLEQDSRVRGKPVSAVCQEGGPYEEYRRRKDLDLEIRRGITSFQRHWTGPP